MVALAELQRHLVENPLLALDLGMYTGILQQVGIIDGPTAEKIRQYTHAIIFNNETSTDGQRQNR
jgi:hypothetical protein